MPTYSAQTGWNEFLALCQNAKSTQDLDQILRLHLTQEEQEAVAMRYLIVRELLKEDKTQRTIAKTLQVSIAKITRGSNSLKIIDPTLKTLLLKHIKKGERDV